MSRKHYSIAAYCIFSLSQPLVASQAGPALDNRIQGLPPEIQEHILSFVPRPPRVFKLGTCKHNKSPCDTDTSIITHIGFTKNNLLIYATHTGSNRYLMSSYNPYDRTVYTIGGAHNLFDSTGVIDNQLVHMAHSPQQYVTNLLQSKPILYEKYANDKETGYKIKIYSNDGTLMAISGKYKRTTPNGIGENCDDTVELYQRRVARWDQNAVLEERKVQQRMDDKNKQQEVAPLPRRTPCQRRCIIS